MLRKMFHKMLRKLITSRTFRLKGVECSDF